MENDELISRFLEESRYEEDKNTLFILAYGSRIMHTDNPGSDLDVLIITSRNCSYKRAMFVDGIPLDITVMSLYDLEKNVRKSLEHGSTYYSSILKNGKVVFDRMNIYEMIQNLLSVSVKRKKHLDYRVLEEAEYHINEFIDRHNKHHYFKALELLRRLHHVNNNCSNIRFTKVYDLYTDKEKARTLYMLKLPDDNYIKKYLEALEETEPDKMLEHLLHFYEEFKNAKFRDVKDRLFLSEDEIRKRLFDLNNAIWKCEDMLIEHHPYAKQLYYILIDEIYSLYELIYYIPLDHIDYESDDPDVLINNLEELFCRLDSRYRMDYNDVILRL